jgi:heterodisulfide reductase subunit A
MKTKERIGVFICHCGTNIAGKIDIKNLIQKNSDKENLFFFDYPYFCSQLGQAFIKEKINQLNLTRIVVAACSPSLHEKTFQKVAQEAGINPYLISCANIREQCSWVTLDKEKATEKAEKIIFSHINRVMYQQPLFVKEVEIVPRVLIIGGGIAGIEAALKIANAGKEVYLVEKEPSIGGHMAKLDKTFPTLDCASCILTPKMAQVRENKNIKLLTYSEVEEVSGFVGNFNVKIRKKARSVNLLKCTGCGSCIEKCPVKVDSEFDMGLSKRKAIYIPFPQAVPNAPVIDRENCLWFTKNKCGVCKKICPFSAIDYDMEDEITLEKFGAIIVAIGFSLFNPELIYQYGYKRFPNVFTSLEIERLLSSTGPTLGEIILRNGEIPKEVAIIHCVGSRDENYKSYCSAICCLYSLKFSYLIKERTKAKIYNFYIDLRLTRKGGEDFYNRVLEEGVEFIRGKPAKIEMQKNGKLVIECEDTLLGKIRKIPVDMVILSPAICPGKDTLSLAKILGLSLSSDGFFQERHPKLAPVSTMVEGIYIAGCCQGPKDIPETVAQAGLAAAEVISLIDKKKIEISPIVAELKEDYCSGCGVCIELCPYNALEYDSQKNKAKLTPEKCFGCGVCVSACFGGALSLKNYREEEILAQIEGIL